MTVTITFAKDRSDLDGLVALLREYLEWDIGQLRRAAGIEIDAELYLTNTLDELDLYFPPRGRLLLARDKTRLVAIGFLKPVRQETCEIKRMYVHPDQRGKGLGKAILSRLIGEARSIGYAKILLDSARYMTTAHALYRSMGFTDTTYYAEGETDEALKDYLLYMEMAL